MEAGTHHYSGLAAAARVEFVVAEGIVVAQELPEAVAVAENTDIAAVDIAVAARQVQNLVAAAVMLVALSEPSVG